eukprot:gb/GECG01000590.1/.p1 GENE.gb/GECG01000590.1/~~gb/GECG01000590.1/.p1  ORF type:complete len:425 (+),score=35.88 gb/GECG01000590.1/:1-1275(+)
MLVSAKKLYDENVIAQKAPTRTQQEFFVSSKEPQHAAAISDEHTTNTINPCSTLDDSKYSGQRLFEELCPPALRQRCRMNLDSRGDSKEFFVPPSLILDFPLDDQMFQKNVHAVDITLSGERDRLFGLLCSQHLDRQLTDEAVAIPLCGLDEQAKSHIILCVVGEKRDFEGRVKKHVEEFKRITRHPHVSIVLEDMGGRRAFVDVPDHLRRAVVCQLLVRRLQQEGWYLQTGRSHIRPAARFKKEEKVDDGVLRYAIPILLVPIKENDHDAKVKVVSCLRLAILGGSSTNSMAVEVCYWAERWLWQDSVIFDRYDSTALDSSTRSEFLVLCSPSRPDFEQVYELPSMQTRFVNRFHSSFPSNIPRIRGNRERHWMMHYPLSQKEQETTIAKYFMFPDWLTNRVSSLPINTGTLFHQCFLYPPAD